MKKTTNVFNEKNRGRAGNVVKNTVKNVFKNAEKLLQF